VHREQRERALPRRGARLEPAIDRLGLCREARGERTAVGGFWMLDAKPQARRLHDVVWVRARDEAQRVAGEPAEQATEMTVRSRLRADAADVVHAGREAPVAPAEGLRQPAGPSVLLEHEHALAASRQCCRCGQSADAGPDDDCVPHGGSFGVVGANGVGSVRRLFMPP
jgi:hypothetical protein